MGHSHAALTAILFRIFKNTRLDQRELDPKPNGKLTPGVAGQHRNPGERRLAPIFEAKTSLLRPLRGTAAALQGDPRGSGPPARPHPFL